MRRKPGSAIIAEIETNGPEDIEAFKLDVLAAIADELATIADVLVETNNIARFNQR